MDVQSIFGIGFDGRNYGSGDIALFELQGVQLTTIKILITLELGINNQG